MLNLKLSALLMVLFLTSLTANGASPADCEAQITGNIRKEIDLGMWLVSQNPDFLNTTSIILDLMSIYPFLNFAEFELSLRRIGSPIYLLAAPARFGAPGFKPAMPVRGGEPIAKERFLYVTIHGENEAREMKRKYGLASDEENLKLLKNDTGLQVR